MQNVAPAAIQHLHASIGPDWNGGPDEDLLEHRLFDNGFHVELRQPSTVADALLVAMELARKARAQYRAGIDIPEPEPPRLAPRTSQTLRYTELSPDRKEFWR